MLNTTPILCLVPGLCWKLPSCSWSCPMVIQWIKVSRGKQWIRNKKNLRLTRLNTKSTNNSVLQKRRSFIVNWFDFFTFVVQDKIYCTFMPSGLWWNHTSLKQIKIKIYLSSKGFAWGLLLFSGFLIFWGYYNLPYATGWQCRHLTAQDEKGFDCGTGTCNLYTDSFPLN